MPVGLTVESLLAERELWQQEREVWQQKQENWQQEREQFHRQVRSDQSEISRLRQIIASLQHKLFGNRKGEVIDEAQLKLHLSGLEESLVQLEAAEQARELREEEAQRKNQSPPKRSRFVFPEQIEEVTEVLEPEEVARDPQSYRRAYPRNLIPDRYWAEG